MCWGNNKLLEGVYKMSIAVLNSFIEKIEADGSGVNGFQKVIEFEFTDLGESFTVKFLGDNAEILTETETPTCTLQLSSDNFRKLTTGELNPSTAFLFGKVKAKGDLGQLLKLSSILDYYK